MSDPTDESPWRLEWSDALSMYNAELDAEHRHFIDLVNDLNEAIVARMDVEVLKRCMQAILDDAAAHFAHEETLFKEWGYPAAQEHAAKHALITQALQGIMGRFVRGGTEYEWIDAGLQVKQALISHLLHDDMKYRDYCVATGRATEAPGQPS